MHINRKKYGLLYNGNEARKACPNGWRLPSESDWTKLIVHFGNDEKANKALKSTSNWIYYDYPGEYKEPKQIEGLNGTNSSGLNIIPSGQYFTYSDDGFTLNGESAGFWTTSRGIGLSDSNTDIYTKLNFASSNRVNKFSQDPQSSVFLSCRCIRKE